MDFSNMFIDGNKPSLDEVLSQREKRVSYIEFLLNKYHSCSVISLKLNTPGPIKNNEYIETLFKIGKQKLKKNLVGKIVFSKEINPPTGPEQFIVIESAPSLLKKIAIDFEENSFGRLFDADVLFLDNSITQNFSREKIDSAPRKCFICSNNAKICSSRRIHSVDELQKAFVAIAEKINN